MGLNKQASVSILELVLYVPAIVLAAAVCIRHGFHRSSGWIFTLILCLVRIIGACCQLASTQSPSKGLFEAVFILQSVGIAPLQLATLGLLSRCADAISTETLRVLHFRLMHVLISVATILSIVGGIKSITPQGTYDPQTTVEAGITLYLVSLAALVIIALVAARKLSAGPKDERRLAWITVFALPLIAVRILYSILAVFSHISEFRPVTGSVFVQIFMAVLEEFVVVLMYLVVGWMTSASEKAGPIAGRPWNGAQGNVELGGRRSHSRRNSHARDRK